MWYAFRARKRSDAARTGWWPANSAIPASNLKGELRVADALDRLSPDADAVWRPIETAPKDGTTIHVQRVYEGRIIYEGPAAWVHMRFGSLA